MFSFGYFPGVRLNFADVSGTLCQVRLQRLDVAFEDGPDRGCRNVGKLNLKNILHPAFEDGPDRGFRNVGKT
jgi:hypothetical protein